MMKGSPVLTKVLIRIKFPEKLKGTFIEKWAHYWKNLCVDYWQMLIDLRTDIQNEPVKALKWTAGLGATYTLVTNNPDETQFKDHLKNVENKVALVSEECLNDNAAEHLRFLRRCYNEGLMHYTSLGFFSIMYTSNLNESCDLFKAHCAYTKPTLWSIPSQIVDVGLMGRWWNLYKKTVNYDVNFR